MLRARYSRRHRTARVAPDTVLNDRLICAVCRFPGVDAAMTPGEQLGPQPTTVTGSTYVWTNANDPLSGLDKEVVAVRQTGECPFCGSERFLDGRRGSALRIP